LAIDADSIVSGQVIGHYEVVSELGRGGMAVVYSVRDQRTDQRCAMKVLNTPMAGAKARLLREGQLQGALTHPNIVRILEVVDVDGLPGLVMEYVDGQTLSEFIANRQQIDLGVVDQVAEGMIRGVAAAHALGMIHRDLKPSNILLSREGGRYTAKVADFGLAKALTGDLSGPTLTRSGISMGTPCFMSPEQVQNARDVSLSSDIFSLGSVLFELATGTRAFPGDTVMAVLGKVCMGSHQPFPDAPALPQRMVASIEWALRVDPELRAKDCTELLSAWRGETALPEVTNPAAGPTITTLVPPASAPTRRSVIPILVGVASLLAVAVAVVVNLPPAARIEAAPPVPVSVMAPEAQVATAAPKPDPEPAVGAIEAPVVAPIAPVQPMPKPEQEVEPESEATPVNVPSEPEPGPRPTVTVTGEATKIWFETNGERFPPGDLAPGHYAVLASFPGSLRLSQVTEVDIQPGQTVQLRCRAALKSCVAEVSE
jgi:eukaryotic-like serine/threonine-protein kinase